MTTETILDLAAYSLAAAVSAGLVVSYVRAARETRLLRRRLGLPTK